MKWFATPISQQYFKTRFYTATELAHYPSPVEGLAHLQAFLETLPASGRVRQLAAQQLGLAQACDRFQELTAFTCIAGCSACMLHSEWISDTFTDNI